MAFRAKQVLHPACHTPPLPVVAHTGILAQDLCEHSNPTHNKGNVTHSSASNAFPNWLSKPEGEIPGNVQEGGG